MKKHTNKEIRAAIEYALKHGWRFEECRGHAFGRLYCGEGHKEHSMSVWSTPKNTENHAKQIKRMVDKCRP